MPAQRYKGMAAEARHTVIPLYRYTVIPLYRYIVEGRPFKGDAAETGAAAEMRVAGTSNHTV
jgi:hypothetical protein